MQSRRRDPSFQSGAERLPALRARALQGGPPREMASALRAGPIAVIAEIKRASPSRGVLASDLDAARQAAIYEAAGARAVSVLTEPHHFRGSLVDLEAARAACALPVLRKDFLTEEWEIWEARAHGADAVLLIAALLDVTALRGLRMLAEELGMAALVEAHDEAEVDAALASGATLLGINNRDLRTFQVDLGTTVRLMDRVPHDVLVVSESGIATRDDVRRVADAGARAVLVGESLVRDPDPAARLRHLLGTGDAGSGSYRFEHSHERTP